ncbi:hypothetical protein PV794_15630, partial [Comamonas aquatica]|nr:hypothetical protein [Comamonas aquatica]
MPACSPPSSPDTARRQWLASALAVPSLGLVGCTTPAIPVPTAGDAAAWGQPWHMPGVRYMDLPAPALPGSPTPRQHRVMVYVPQGPAPAAGWPVVYVLDGNLMFPLLAQLVHNRGARGPSCGPGRHAGGPG